MGFEDYMMDAGFSDEQEYMHYLEREASDMEDEGDYEEEDIGDEYDEIDRDDTILGNTQEYLKSNLIQIIVQIKEELQKDNYQKVIELSQLLESPVPALQGDISSIQKAVKNRDFGSCEIFIDSFLNRWEALKEPYKSEIVETKQQVNIGQLISIGAITAYENITNPFPISDIEWAKYYYNEAVTYLKLRQEDKVEDMLLKSLIYDKTYLLSVCELIYLYRKHRQYDRCIDVIDYYYPFQDTDNKKQALLYEKAYVEYEQKHFEEALKILNNSILVNPSGYDDTYLLRASIYLNTSKNLLALQDYTTIKTNNPKLFGERPDALMNYVLLSENLNIDEKIDLLQKSVALMPQWSLSNYNLGFYLKRRKEYKQALPHLLIAYKQNVKDVDTIREIADCYYITDQSNEAKEFYKKGAELGCKYCRYNLELLIEKGYI